MTGQDSTLKTHEGSLDMRRKRYQKGSLQRRKHRRRVIWAALWWQDGSRRYRTLGLCSKMTQSEARLALNSIILPLNRAAQERQEKPRYTVGQFIDSKYLPF